MPRPSHSPPEQGYPRLRRVGLLFAWSKTALVLAAAMAVAGLGGGQDPAGRAFLYGGFVLGGIYWLALVLPSLLALRASTGRRVGLAFALLILPDLALALAASLA